MRRRDFITLLGGAAATWPLAARAQQQPTMPLIGFLHYGSAEAYAHIVSAVQQGLRESGFIEGQNVAVEYRWAEGQYDRLPALAGELVQRQVLAIIAAGVVAAEPPSRRPRRYRSSSPVVRIRSRPALSPA